MFALSFTANAQTTRTLDYYISSATARAPQIIDYNNRILSNALDSARLRAGFGPQVNATGDLYYAPVINGFGYDPIITNNGNVAALVGVSQPVVSKANSRNQYELLHLQNELTKDSLGLWQQALHRDVTTLYLTAYGNWVQMLYYDTTLTLLSQEQTVLRGMTENGTYKQIDYLNFNIALQQQRLQRAQLLRQYRAGLAELNYTCGLYDTNTVILQSPSLSLDSSYAATRTLLYRHFTIDSMRLLAEDRQINFTYRPKLNLFADAGYNSTLTIAPQKNFGASGGLNLIVPIYNGGLKNLEHQKIKLNEATRKAYRDFFMTQYQQQHTQLEQELQATNALLQQTQQQLTYTQTAVQAYHKLLTAGNVSITDYLTAVTNYINAKNLAALNTVNRWQLVNSLNYLNQTRR